MKAFGMKIPVNHQYECFYWEDMPHPVEDASPRAYTVEGDWSGGAFLLVAGAIQGDIIVQGLDGNSTQADRKIMEALASCGAKFQVEGGQIRLSPVASGTLRGFQFDATDCPDLFPPLVALASYCIGQTVITGARRLTYKESNRALTLQEEFAKMGVAISLAGDQMIIDGKGKAKGATVHSRHDHRIAMACAVAALRANGETLIEEAEAVNKSYTDFYDHLQSLGATLTKYENIHQ
jgi:3-phosphoshikimate 1-carboxyvinyltransferase